MDIPTVSRAVHLSGMSPLSICGAIGAVLLVFLMPAQVPGGAPLAGPAALVLPIGGAALSARQSDERTRTLSTGALSSEIIRATVYRDSVGTMRIESAQGRQGESFDIVSLLDPIAGSVVTLLTRDKVAARIRASDSGKGRFAFAVPDMAGPLPNGTWQAREEHLGKRVVEGVEVEGIRTTRTCKEQPGLIAIEERWFSHELGLIVSAELSGPNWRHTFKLQNIVRREQDPALFVIPSDYSVLELGTGLP